MIAGKAQNSSAAYLAVLFRPNGTGDAWTVLDLNTRLNGGSGWVLQSAHPINEAGVIVGTGTSGGVSASWIALPTP